MQFQLGLFHFNFLFVTVMALFLAQHTNKIDKKGRVSVPSGFRAVLSSQSFQGVVLFASPNHPCLEGFPMSFMETISERLDHFDMFSSAQDDLATTIFGESVPLPLDGDGRIIIPEALTNHLGQDLSHVQFVGLGQKFQIWAPDTFAARADAARKTVKDKSLVIPKGGANG